MKLQNYNTSKITYKILYPNSFCLSFYKIMGKLVLPSFCVYLWQHTSLWNGYISRYAIILSLCQSSLYYIATIFQPSSPFHHIYRQRFHNSRILIAASTFHTYARPTLTWKAVSHFVIRPGYYCYYTYYNYYCYIMSTEYSSVFIHGQLRNRTSSMLFR